MTTKNRETYLSQAITQMRPLFKSVGAPLPLKIKVTCGWPSKSAGRSSKRRIGECWPAQASAAHNIEIIISMVVDGTIEALDILVHELVHAAVGLECGHRGAFKRVALAVGLEGKMTSTTAGPELTEKLKRIQKRIGDYPHSAIDFSRKKQTTRMVKVTCENLDCGMVFRTSNKWMEFAPDGFDCPACNGPTTRG